MERAKKKLKRIGPVLKAKNAEMEQEAGELAAIRREKKSLEEDLAKQKEAYIKCVDQLNSIRQSGSFGKLRMFENGLDVLKTKFGQAFDLVGKKDREERHQLMIVGLAQKNLKAVEKLEEKYQNDFAMMRAKEEQKLQDDQSIERRFFVESRQQG